MNDNRKQIKLWGGLLLLSVALWALAGCGAPAETPATQTAGEVAASASASSAAETAQGEVSESAEEEAQTPEATPTTTPTPTATPTPTESPTATPTPTPTLTAKPLGPPAAQVLFDAYYTENNEETAEIIGFDNAGRELWSVDIEKYPAKEVIQCQEIGIANDAYYYVEGGKLVARDLRDGAVLWENRDFGGTSANGVFDEDGTLYLCGYHRPDLFVVDKKGKTKIRIDVFDTNYNYPDEIKVEGDQLVIHYEENNGTLRINKETGELATEAAPAVGYSDEELLNMAIRYTGYLDAEAEIRERNGDEVTILVYYDHPEEIEVIMWYWIDERTGEGIDLDGNPVDFRTVN